MKRILHLIMIITTIFLYSCSNSDSDGYDSEVTTGKIHGSVVIGGEPVNAAAILLTPGGGTKITGSDGEYNFSNLQPGKYELKIYKEGLQSFNKSIDIIAGKEEELAITMTKSIGSLSINKSYVDMGSNESNNMAGFTIINNGTSEIKWQIANNAKWLTQIDPQNGTLSPGGAAAVAFAINRSRLSNNTIENYTTLLVRSALDGDGSSAELLVTVFGNGDGANIENDNSDIDYVMVGDLYVQTIDLGVQRWHDADRACRNTIVGGYSDWRLPTLDELSRMYVYRDRIGGFITEERIDYTTGGNLKGLIGYWSSDDKSEYFDIKEGEHMAFDFSSGKTWARDDWWGQSCRCVRTVSK